MQQEYGCDIYGQYEYPYNTMSQDWSGDQVEGFYYHEITEECKKAGGQFPVIMQVYTYIICEQNDVDYEMVFALIERESKCVWNAAGNGGASVGLMQIAEKWQQERMKELNCTDLTQPFQNVRVGVDILSELQEKLKEGGFQVVEENVKSLWNPDEEDFSKVPALVKALLEN